MGKEIKLDSGVFKALSSDTRMDIIRSLGDRRKTVTELSRDLDISKSTAHEHLSRLNEADLVDKADSGNKWVYYELTKKAENILNPGRETRLILFALSGIAVLTGSYEFYRAFHKFFGQSSRTMAAMEKQAEAVSRTARVQPQIDFLHLVLGIILISAAIYLLWRAYTDKKLIPGGLTS